MILLKSPRVRIASPQVHPRGRMRTRNAAFTQAAKRAPPLKRRNSRHAPLPCPASGPEGALSPAMTTRIRHTVRIHTQRKRHRKRGGTRTRLKITDDLRPDGDHADEHGQGGKGRGFLDDGFEHDYLPRTYREHSSWYVLMSRPPVYPIIASRGEL